ncbi:MAG: nucleotidyltransferase domain-containing protein [Chitinophagaceae bacterium]|nr:MAG: nucleotidyltransferase domain-containing protein [Chitinophagaceae bacterium]
MWQAITDKIEQIRAEQGIAILFCCESGSRGWQFPSPDSDYDVRFIYVRPFNYYLSVSDLDYDLSFPINDDLDIYGWDIRKVLQLIRKSNTTPFEWLQSPIVYAQQAGFRDQLWQLCQSYFSQRTNVHHYLGIARGFMEHLNPSNEIGIKKLFYIIRPVLSAKWCLEKNSIAPMTIGPLLDQVPEVLKKTINQLIRQKATADEKSPVTISPHLREYLESEYNRISTDPSLPDKTSFPLEPLDEFFINTLRSYDSK